MTPFPGYIISKVRTSGVITDRSILFSNLCVTNLSLAIISCKSDVIGRFYVTSFELSLHLVGSSLSFFHLKRVNPINIHSVVSPVGDQHFLRRHFFDNIGAAQISNIIYRSLNLKQKVLCVISYLMTM